MHCSHCGSELSDSSKYCPHCGKPILLTGSEGSDTVPREKALGQSPSDSEERPERTRATGATVGLPPEEVQPRATEERMPELTGLPAPTSASVTQPTHLSNLWAGLIVVVGVIAIAVGIGRASRSASAPTTGDQPVDVQTSQTDWKPYSAPDGAFTVLFPGIPEVESKTVKALSFDVKMDTYTWDSDGGVPAYLVTVGTYPWAAATASEVDARAMLGGAIGGMGNSAGWSPVSSTQGSDGGFYTLDFSIKGVDNLEGLYMNGRAWTKRTNGYVMAAVVSDTAAPEYLDKFLDSLVPG